MSAPAEIIAEKYVEAHGADRKKGGGSRTGPAVGDSCKTVGGSDRKTVCFCSKKVGHRNLNCHK